MSEPGGAVWISSVFLKAKLICYFTFTNVPVAGVSAAPYEDNLRYFNVAIAGPEGCCYEGVKLR